jgi:hypothetical protein
MDADLQRERVVAVLPPPHVGGDVLAPVGVEDRRRDFQHAVRSRDGDVHLIFTVVELITKVQRRPADNRIMVSNVTLECPCSILDIIPFPIPHNLAADGRVNSR